MSYGKKFLRTLADSSNTDLELDVQDENTATDPYGFVYAELGSGHCHDYKYLPEG